MQTESITYIIIGLLAAVILLLIVLLAKTRPGRYSGGFTDIMRKELAISQKDLEEDLTAQVKTINETSQQSIKAMGSLLKERQDSFSVQQGMMNESMQHFLRQVGDGIFTQLDTMYKRMESLEKSNEKSLEGIRASVSENMKDMREENTRKLDEIRGTVDEKLQTTLEKRISESFKTVSDQLEQVYKGLGEMQNLANDVGGLKKVLSGVKTRGILGEVQLGAILEEILAPEQYDVNVATIPGSSNRVEYAVKLPGPDGSVYLPIDAKFSLDRYSQLLDAQAAGDRALVDAAYNALAQAIKNEAKDIRDKYIETPYTTHFGIMFLPFEGLYAEVVSHGLLEELQQKYNVNVAGPSTMAALLNSLQMGFRTLAIQKKSSEVWTVLGAVKTEFDKFESGMQEMQKHLNKTSASLETLMGTRTRAIQRKLREVQSLDSESSDRVLGLLGPEEAED